MTFYGNILGDIESLTCGIYIPHVSDSMSLRMSPWNVTQSQFCVSSPYARDSMKRGKSTNCSTAELVLEFFAKKNSSSNCCLWHVVQCSVQCTRVICRPQQPSRNSALLCSHACTSRFGRAHQEPVALFTFTPRTSCSLHLLSLFLACRVASLIIGMC